MRPIEIQKWKKATERALGDLGKSSFPPPKPNETIAVTRAQANAYRKAEKRLEKTLKGLFRALDAMKPMSATSGRRASAAGRRAAPGRSG
jgi:hypothetical protein